MNVYFTASIVGKRWYLSQYQEIVATLRKAGHTVTADHILSTSEEHISFETRSESEKFHKRIEQWITSCDAVVAEATYPSISVGYELSLALHHRKPILILYHLGEPPSLFHQFQEELVMCQQYQPDQLPSIMEGFLRYAADQGQVRFTLSLPAPLAHFLEQAAYDRHISKADLIRALLADHMRQLG